ncbi:MAG: alpha-galactosidase [Lachnospiraceae bacterium]|nr:alpha-galactosidase [Lachnospiraceae bacterium]MDD6428400.1 alpha-galactosidase [Lachnospiraceae bacterium]
MSIVISKDKKIISIHTKHSTYQMMQDEHDRLLHLYFGKRSEGRMDYLLGFYDRGFAPNPYDASDDRTYSLDVLPQEYPVFGSGDFRETALLVESCDGRFGCDLKVSSVSTSDGKYRLEGLPSLYADDDCSQTLVITLEDKYLPLKVKLYYGVIPELDIITRACEIINTGDKKLYVKKADSAVLDFISGDYDLISFYGFQGLERNLERTRVCHKGFQMKSRRGTSSHQFNPLCILADHSATEDFGECYSIEMLYSGGCEAYCGKDPYGMVRFSMGMSDHLLSYPLFPGDHLVTPEAMIAYSDSGLASLSHHMHDAIRDHVMKGPYQKRPTPVLLNSWEGCYFDFDGKKLVELAGEAARLGADLFVLDDGWFGKRDDDKSGLGDWYTNEKKLGFSLKELSAEVHKKGIQFGLWIEPEMVNEDSDLYRSHPDYALCVRGRKPILGRSQLVLDFSRKEVRDNVFDQITRVLDSCEVEYIKWDCNRSIADVYSYATSYYDGRKVEGSFEQGRVLYDYVLGLYDFLHRLGKRYPKMLIETCSGGGGRFDAGMLQYSRQIWCSDNTDAIDRLSIQYGTSFGYPIDTMGAHISAIPNEQSGRITPLLTRSITAMAGTYGLELDPSKLSIEEKEEIHSEIAERHRYEQLIATGDYYRLSSPLTDPFTAFGFVSKDKTKALIHVVKTTLHFADEYDKYVVIKGLLPDSFYRRSTDGKIFPSNAIMNVGIPLPKEKGEYRAYRWYLEKV